MKSKLIPAITKVRNISVVQNDSDTYKVKAYNVESKIDMFAENRETVRNLSTRLTEHKLATRNGDVNNHIAEHHLQTKHRIDWDFATCITHSTGYYQRLTLESWFTNSES